MLRTALLLMSVLVLGAALYSLWPVRCGRGAGPNGRATADLLGGLRVPLALSEKLEPACERSASFGMQFLGISLLSTGVLAAALQRTRGT